MGAGPSLRRFVPAAIGNLRVDNGNSSVSATGPADPTMANGATEPLTASERSVLEEKLKLRRDELRAEIAAQLKNQDDPRLVGLRNRMEDTDDWAAADAMAAMDIASVSRVLTILSDVEAALARLAEGSYGECIDCGVAIPFARLAAYPAAKRCVGCQEIAEALLRRSGSPR